MQYKVHIHWGNFKKYPPRIGEIDSENYMTINQLLEAIFVKEQNDNSPKPIPSASCDDVIEIGDGRNFVILAEGFAEVRC